LIFSLQNHDWLAFYTIRMEQTPLQDLESPRIEEAGPVLIAGLGGRCNDATSIGIPALWQRFAPHINHIPGQIGAIAYGVMCNYDGAGNWDCVCGVEVSGFSNLPAEFRPLTVPKQKYAVFSHRGHISTIRGTWNYISREWLPGSGMRIANAPKLERYSENFDPAIAGGVEIWIPIEA
jgi:AraC family transcriptional regulator